MSEPGLLMPESPDSRMVLKDDSKVLQLAFIINSLVQLYTRIFSLEAFVGQRIGLKTLGKGTSF